MIGLVASLVALPLVALMGVAILPVVLVVGVALLVLRLVGWTIRAAFRVTGLFLAVLVAFALFGAAALLLSPLGLCVSLPLCVLAIAACKGRITA